jgi:hypothetical protein
MTLLARVPQDLADYTRHDARVRQHTIAVVVRAALDMR